MNSIKLLFNQHEHPNTDSVLQHIMHISTISENNNNPTWHHMPPLFLSSNMLAYPATQLALMLHITGNTLASVAVKPLAISVSFKANLASDLFKVSLHCSQLYKQYQFVSLWI